MTVLTFAFAGTLRAFTFSFYFYMYYLTKILIPEILKFVPQDGHHSEINVEDDPRFDEASNLVKQLADASIVYRIFNKSVGNVLVDDFQNYSIRGYFMPMQNTGYQFMSYTTIKQYWTISNVSRTS